MATGLSFKFIRPVYFGETITSEVELTRVDKDGRAEARADFVNARGELKAKVHMTGRLPVETERALLGEMVAQGDFHNPL